MKRWMGWTLWGPLLGCALACNGLSGLGLGTETPYALPTIAPITATPSATAVGAATPAETASPQTTARLAWIGPTSLNITDFSGEGLGATSHIVFAAQGLPGASEVAWSPDGKALAVSSGSDTPQLYEVGFDGLTAVTGLGAGTQPAWSPDGKSLVAERDGNLWRIDPSTQTTQQLTAQEDWHWGNAIFAPDGSGLIVAGAAADLMGAQGNTEFFLYRIPLDGSGSLTQLPALDTAPFFGRLPYDLQLSPNGQSLSFSTSAHVNACASPTAYYVGKADGTGWREVASATINAALDSDKEIYQEGQGLIWLPDSTGVVLDSFAWDCSSANPTQVAGPLLSVVGLDGAERASLPLDLANLSMDTSGRLLAGLAYPVDGSPALVKVYSLTTGLPVAELGEGTAVVFAH